METTTPLNNSNASNASNNKSCNTQNYCSYKFLGAYGNGCNYYGYCDYQTPRDSRQYFNYVMEEKKEI